MIIKSSSSQRIDAPVVEILGPWVKNKGDQLMLLSVVERLSGSFVLAASTDMRVEGVSGLPEFPPSDLSTDAP